MARSNVAVPRDDAVAWANELYANGVDRKDANVFADAFIETGWCRFANNPRLEGREAIRTAIAGFFTVMAGVSHETVGTFYDDGDLVLEANVTYTLHQGGTVTVPAVTIFRMTAGPDGPAAESCRIFVDLAPLFSAAVPAPSDAQA